MPPTGVSSSSSRTSSSSLLSIAPPPRLSRSRPRLRPRPRPRRRRLPRSSSSPWLFWLPPWPPWLPPERCSRSAGWASPVTMATASAARRARSSLLLSLRSPAGALSETGALLVDAAGAWLCSGFAAAAGAATTPPFLMASTRSLFFILDTPETPNSEASACNWGIFMALRAAPVLAATLVSVNCLSFPRTGPCDHEWCECFHLDLQAYCRAGIARWVALRRGDLRLAGGCTSRLARLAPSAPLLHGPDRPTGLPPTGRWPPRTAPRIDAHRRRPPRAAAHGCPAPRSRRAP